ncbi:alkaline phosphatase-like protein [Saccharata proteae CBS 121410]|uniref:Alkaline phosphatase-like protein n=1 Tax=Saccharata proteae CBS 121410 TaxID=1314787 RepID=A0A9P4HV53_9PEZI|nr:alkaline phosphatase-like protein [Saccharata proteae CBS 121410]
MKLPGNYSSTALLALLFLLATQTTTVTAKYTTNLNYRSPSEHHPFLGISIYKVVKRNDPAVRFIEAGKLNFTHGVASGDPESGSVILWTRCSPMYDDDKSNATVSGTVPLFNHDTEEYIRVSTAPVCVNYKVATDSAMQDCVDSGTAYTTSDIDYTLKVEAKNLSPFTTYYYQFNVCGSNNTSPVGRTKTTPSPTDTIAQVNLAVFSCSNYPFGFFNAFGNSARKDAVDFVLHLGDFIYEYAEGAYGYGWSIGRVSQPNKELRSLYDYRKRHATYRADLDSIESFGRFAWIPVWDDHEVADNVYRDGVAHQNNTEASFILDGLEDGGDGVSFDQRKMNAVRAYFEWMPIRQVEMDDNLRIWRNFKMGKLMDVIMLDTRNYDRSITDLYWNTDYIHEISNDAGRSMMGSRQENWFYNQLTASAARNATWRLIGSQTVFSRQNESLAYGSTNPLDYDAWDGYVANRNRTFAHLRAHNISNNIVMAGDSHLSWVSDLTQLSDEYPYDPETGEGSVGVEFAGSAVSSPCPYGQNISMEAANNASAWLVAANPELQWQDTYYRGYYELSVSVAEVKARYFGVPTVVQRTPLEVSLANFTVVNGENRLKRPVGGGVVASGALKAGVTVVGNLTNDTSTGMWSKRDLDMFGYGQSLDG